VLGAEAVQQAQQGRSPGRGPVLDEAPKPPLRSALEELEHENQRERAENVRSRRVANATSPHLTLSQRRRLPLEKRCKYGLAQWTAQSMELGSPSAGCTCRRVPPGPGFVLIAAIRDWPAEPAEPGA